MTIDGWVTFPSGRWCTTRESHGGHLALHAWVGGEWAITRGQANIKAGEPFVIGSREKGQPTGKDLHQAMRFAEAAAQTVMDSERPDTGAVQQPVDLFNQP